MTAKFCEITGYKMHPNYEPSNGEYQALYLHGHGGYCCGMSHLRGFPSVTTPGVLDAFIKLMDNLEETYGWTQDGRHLLEVVLTTHQACSWEKHLLAKGFKKVGKFNNMNSGNDCIVYWHGGITFFNNGGK
jgi:hypothetical protein